MGCAVVVAPVGGASDGEACAPLDGEVEGVVTVSGVLRWRDEERLIPVQDDERQKNCEKEPTFHVLRLGMRDWIHAVAAERMAPCQTPASKPHTAPWSVDTHGVRHVVGAGWIVPARSGKKRREKKLVALKKCQDEDGAQSGGPFGRTRSHTAR